VDEIEVLPASIGSELGSAILVPGVAPLHARLVRSGGDVAVQDPGSSVNTFLAGEPVREAPLQDGDILELGRGGPRLRYRNESEGRVPLLQALDWARPEGAPKRLEDTTGFLKALAYEAEARTSRVFRVTVGVLLLVTASLLGWSSLMSRRLQRQLAQVQDSVRRAEEERRALQGRIDDERRRADAERRAARDRAAEFRARQEALQKEVAEATNGQVEALREELAVARGRLEALEKENAVGERIIRDYGTGVCLIQGSYAFYDDAGRPLRERVDEQGEPVTTPQGAVEVSVDGEGPLHTVDVLGTGFLVDRRGWIVTNRHVGEPWWKDDAAGTLVAKGLHPKLLLFRAFFPKLPAPVNLNVVRHAEGVDLSLLKADFQGRKDVPALPLDLTGRGAVPGKPVVVVGYPTGLEAILAKADGAVVDSLLSLSGTRSDQLAEALGRKGLIRPSTTQGHIGDVTRTDIVFDAPTTQGGSGGPVFNQEGLVIAVEYAVLPKFGGNSFGIPVRNVVQLLRGGEARNPAGN
jgi:S1-C subfamily serine protease